MKNWFRAASPAPPEEKTSSISTPSPAGLDTKASATGGAPLIALHMSGRAVWTPRDYGTLSRQGYQKNAIVYRCIRLIAEAAASVPFCVRRGNQCLENDPAAQFLAQGNPDATVTEIFEQFYGYLQVSGNGYFEGTLVDGVPIALYALRPDRVSVITNKQGWVTGWDYTAGGFKRTFRRDHTTGCAPIYHMRLFHPTHDQYGFSPLEAAAQAVDVHNEGGRWTKALLDNSARPSGALIYKGASGSDRLSDEQFDRLKTELEGSHTGVNQAGRPMLLEGGLDWKAMSLSPSDMDFIEARREAAREIALAFGVPPMLLGIPGDNTYANYKEANQAFWRQTIIPLTRKTAKGLSSWLRPFFGDDLVIAPELDQVPALTEERAALWQGLMNASFLTDDERRSLAGFMQKETI